MGPWIKLATHLGAFIGQLTNEPIEEVNILLDGVASEMNTNALDCAVLAGMMKPVVSEVNMVSAPMLAADRGIKTSTTTQAKSGVFHGYIKLTMKTPTRQRAIAGTVFSDGKPRFIQIKGITIDAEIGQHMVYTTN
ncbi:MAG: phosphoglycerate dehydrogenase, partial [Maritimibacter sp.]|nr:phosphoglycerate dehydrogenase [Maritimibacter sp.]